MSIIEHLESKRDEIDSIIEKYVPREYCNKTAEFVLGKATYSYDTTAFTKAIAEPVWEFLDRGGKRWRPALFFLVVEALDGDMEKVKDLVAIPELVHNGTLMIDDMEDGSDYRRGELCSHKKFGNDIAANCSGVLYYLPLMSIIKNKDKFDTETLLKIYETYTEEMLRVGFGQATDISWHKGLGNANNISEEEYLQMCYNKTGCLARMSAKIAAIVSNAEPETVSSLGHLAGTIGVAFQIQDDLLNLTAESGKGQFIEEYIGSDITEGKRTLMVIHTMQNASKEDKERLLEILDMHSKEKEIIQEAIQLMKKYNSITYAKKRAKELMEESWNEVDEILKPSEAKEKLHAFAKFLIERDV